MTTTQPAPTGEPTDTSKDCTVRTIEHVAGGRSLWYIKYDNEESAVKIGRSQYSNEMEIKVTNLRLFVQHLYEVAGIHGEAVDFSSI